MPVNYLLKLDNLEHLGMKWSIPAKTFLLGEYAAIAGASAMVLTTSPCFELSLSAQPGLQDIHKDSPAGRYWMQQNHHDVGLQWHDPYRGLGGMGASSAQFIGAYLATQYLQKKIPTQADLLEAYFQCAWQGAGTRPSGYDMMAQSLQGCVYINQQQGDCQTLSWPFPDITFLLLHTGKKLPTHQHLQDLVMPNQLHLLTDIVSSGKQAIESVNSGQMIEAVNAYHQQLMRMKWVADHSIQLIESFNEQGDILAAKGCGAMGSDVLLFLVPTNKEYSIRHHFLTLGWNTLATSANLYDGPSLI